MSNVSDIRTAKSRAEGEKLKQPSTPQERRMQDFAQEVSKRLDDIEKRQRRIDAVLGRILKKLKGEED